jgi:hypothetical protein
MKSVLTLPRFDSGQYEGSEFLMAGGGAVLTILLAELPAVRITFQGVRWHEFTAVYNCTSEQVQAYFQVVEVAPSAGLAAYIASDKASARAYRDLRHYRIFLDETGCHELYAQSCGP